MHSWQLQEAKAHLSQVVKEALNHGPQEISLRGKPAVVVISRLEYDKLVAPQSSLVVFMQNSPLKNTKINLVRDKSLTRKTKL